MGLLDGIKKQVEGGAGSTSPSTGQTSGHSGLLSGALEMLSGQGFGNLVRSFKEKGLSDVVSSWIGTGQNLPISPDQIHSVLGSEKVRQLAEKAGLSPQEAASKLSTVLPEVVDKATPNGQFDPGAILQQGMSFLKNKIG